MKKEGLRTYSKMCANCWVLLFEAFVFLLNSLEQRVPWGLELLTDYRFCLSTSLASV